jgi:Protein of unknown function (DUF3379)
MMDCTAYRRSMLADPNDPDRELREHRDGCHECTEFTGKLLRFESRLDRALRVTLPDEQPAASPAVQPVVPLPAKAAPLAMAYRKRMFAMAASVLLAVVVAGVLWVAAPGSSLAADVVTHMGGEPGSWLKTDVPVDDSELQQVLQDSHVKLAAGADLVSYAASCAFRGHHVPHLVIQTESGPVTVMVLVHESVKKPVQFDEQGYRGVIVPVAGHGSLAVLTRGSSPDRNTVDLIAARVLDSITWTP